MNRVPQTTQFCCPSCKGFIGEAAPIDAVVDEITSPAAKAILSRLSKTVGKPVSRANLIDEWFSGDAGDAPDDAENEFHVHMNRLRKQIAPYGWSIKASGKGNIVNGANYRLMPAEVSA